ncbi:hypothetical protein [Kiloniella sp.]|uniref:hypothetical protein n=1 Tax=Kiloniella sp. TaxID=1938587 RepID=UPI003B02E452
MTDTERKRASLFSDENEPDDKTSKKKINLDRFAPKKAPPIDTNILETLSEEAGFTTSHAKKTVAKRDGRKLKKSARTTQFNVRLKPQTAERFWVGAENKGLEYADDFMEYLLDVVDAYESKDI